ncbi:MAG: hypothetical protein WC083_06235 [Candidatus Methanomethylophilaceae archaeon]|jgi:hypothetical protein
MVPLIVEGEGCKAFLTPTSLILKSDDSCIVLKGEVWKAIKKALIGGGLNGMAES